MSNLPSAVQENIHEQSRVVETLLGQHQIVFESRTVETTDEMGIYVFSNRHTNEILYVGQTRKGIQSRLKDHWDGPTSSDLSNRLVMEGLARNVAEGRAWIKENVSIRCLTGDELGTCIKWAEHFAIAALRPKFNK